MSKKKSRKKPKSSLEILQSIRKDWGQVKPYTRIEPDKKTIYDRKKKCEDIKEASHYDLVVGI